MKSIFNYFRKPNNIISVIGSGGKTTLIYSLAEYYANTFKKRVLITTTAKILYTTKFPVYLENNFKKLAKSNEPIIIAGSKVSSENKILPLQIENIKKLSEIFSLILIEADGSKGKSLKAYEYYEPMIPEFTDIVITVVGMDIIGKNFSHKNVHRFEILKKILDKSENSLITPDDVKKTILKCYVPNLTENYLNFLILNKTYRIIKEEVLKIKIEIQQKTEIFENIFIKENLSKNL